MKLTRFEHAGVAKVGSVNDDDTIVDLTSALASEFGKISSMRALLDLGEAGMEAVKKAISQGDQSIPMAHVQMLAPIHDADKVLCIGMNYADHCIEQDFPIPTEPIIFSKFGSSVIASGDPILYTPDMKELDFEVEMAVIIGKPGKNISKEKAMDHVFGYATSHDVSERWWQLNGKKNGGQWLLGKHRDDFCPLSPIIPKDQVSDPHKLGLRCILNGKSMQDSNTDQMIFKTDELIQFISQFMTLSPGDIILTGTPPGVGCFIKPDPIWLKIGDEITCEIDEIGSVTNKVIKA